MKTERRYSQTGTHSAVSRHVRAVSLLNAEKHREAIALCAEILAGQPDFLPAVETKARARWRMGCYAAALEDLDEALRLNPYDPGYRFMRGDCLQMLGRYGEAVSEFEQCAACQDPVLAGEAAERAHSLDAWQADLVAWLLGADPIFKATYDRCPESALSERGFRFSAKPRQTAMSHPRDLRLWARSS